MTMCDTVVTNVRFESAV